MVDISALQDTLSGVVPDTGFMLDNRSVLHQLQYIEQYARYIPYAPGLSWADYLFMNGNTPEKLAALYQDPSTADGYLPPHQAMLLALLSMQETPRAIMNYFPDAHCDLYYRQLLQLQERPAVSSQVALSVALDSVTPELMVAAGTLFSAGQDSQGTAIEFALDEDLLANQSTWSDLRWCLPPARENSAGTSAIVYDDERSWPEDGMPLFSATGQDTAILTGWMLASAGLSNDPAYEYHYTLTFQENVTPDGLSASLSGGTQWLPLAIIPVEGDLTTLVLSLPVDGGEVAPPDGLEGAVFSVPVIRLSREDGLSVPPVSAVELSYMTDEQDANGELVPSEPVPVQCEQLTITPFGHYPGVYIDNGTDMHAVDAPQLFLGIAGLQAGQSLSLFWKLNSPQPLTLRWQYLAADNTWRDLGIQLVDGTRSLYRSGLWTVNLPDDASDHAPAMPAGRHWFRALFPDTITLPDCPWLTGLIANGMTATLVNAGTLDSGVLAHPLPAGTIRRPAEDISGLSEAEQPWESWGGRPPESSEAFFTRVAQRLSHRNRALTWPDMVMILKTAFPYVFEVMTPSGDILTTVPALTTQHMTVIPVAAEKDNDDPLRPVFNAARLRGMQDFLQGLASLWQNIEISNPDYRDVLLEYVVVFREGVNPTWAEKELREALTEHYMPWSTGAAAGAPLANRIDYYEVMASLQQQAYVDHVVSLTLDGAEYSVQGEDDQVLILCWPDAV